MPVPDLEPVTDEGFAETCRAISEGWRRKRGSGAQSAWLEAKVYELADFLCREDYEELIQPREKLLSKRGAPGRRSIYGRLLRVIFHDEPKTPDNKVRERIVNRLEYAWHHLVPPPFLPGFLLKMGPRPKRNHVTPEFQDWIVEQLSEKRNQERRGAYSKAIRKLVKKRRSEQRE